MMHLAALCVLATFLVFGDEFASARTVPPNCTPPKCESPCSMVNATDPCPSCMCPSSNSDEMNCYPSKCGKLCSMNYKARPCPMCECPKLRCQTPKCKPPCHMNYNNTPCESCNCPNKDPTECMLPECPSGTSPKYVSWLDCPVCKQ